MWNWKRYFETLKTVLGDKRSQVVLSSLLITLILSNMDFNLLEANLYDFRMARGSQLKPDSDIVLITIDDTSTHALDEFSPFPLDMHALFMEEMEKLQPKGIGYLVDFNRIDQTNPDLPKKREWANRFVDAANRLQAKGTTVVLGTPFDVAGEVIPPFPLSSLNHSIAVIHKDSNVFSEDKITRRALIALNGKAAFHLDFARKLGALSKDQEPDGTFSVPEADGKYFFFRYHGSTVRNANHPEILPYAHVSFSDVVRGNVPANTFKDKIVLVGTLTREDASDYAFTPYSKSSYTNPKIIIHANILDAILHDQSVKRLPYWVNLVIILVSTAFVLWWVMNSTPLHGVFATLALALLIVAIGQIIFQSSGIWLKESSPLVGIFLSYYLGAPYRLIREYKKRWDYQRKNEILLQVEELKTNFLSLVTHDLKTPVARIQGLAEVLLRKGQERLEALDKETLKHIISSTEELNRFISSILELSKIESNHMQINRESRDINQIIERLVEGFQAQAKSKGIHIEVRLDPLFPIKVDYNLITKVLNNLIDNAIKYSHPNSNVIIESHELDPWVVLSIRDQGIGLSEEEKQSLFTKFYRAKNSSANHISGTGLGLYLTKFFIEAHDGKVEVESEKGIGSTFKVYLPLHAEVGATPLKTKLSSNQDLSKEKNHVHV